MLGPTPYVAATIRAARSSVQPPPPRAVMNSVPRRRSRERATPLLNRLSFVRVRGPPGTQEAPISPPPWRRACFQNRLLAAAPAMARRCDKSPISMENAGRAGPLRRCICQPRPTALRVLEGHGFPSMVWRCLPCSPIRRHSAPVPLCSSCRGHTFVRAHDGPWSRPRRQAHHAMRRPQPRGTVGLRPTQGSPYRRRQPVTARAK
jgi:hypothetical protein